MSLAAVLLTPFVLLFPATGVIEMRELHRVPSAAIGETPSGQDDPSLGAPVESPPSSVFRDMAESFRVRSQNQVRIEQHMTIRISPARPLTPPPVFLDFPRGDRDRDRDRDPPTRIIERNIGRCVPVSGISGVQPDAGNRLLLFMRDRRVVSAMLERACRARDFYSGFYVERTPDGQLCVDRDTLLSRSGANCKLTRIRQLIETDE